METFQLLNAWKAGLQSSIGNLQLFCLSGSQRRPSQRRPSLTGRMAGLISPGRQSGDSTGRGDVKFTLAQVLEKSDKLVRKKCIKMLQPLAIQLITIMCRYQNMIKYIYIHTLYIFVFKYVQYLFMIYKHKSTHLQFWLWPSYNYLGRPHWERSFTSRMWVSPQIVQTFQVCYSGCLSQMYHYLR